MTQMSYRFDLRDRIYITRCHSIFMQKLTEGTPGDVMEEVTKTHHALK